jgi:hypothetical protein
VDLPPVPATAPPDPDGFPHPPPKINVSTNAADTVSMRTSGEYDETTNERSF